MKFCEALIIESWARVFAAMVRVEGMKVANVMRERGGNAPAYGETEFYRESDSIQIIADEIRGLAERL